MDKEIEVVDSVAPAILLFSGNESTVWCSIHSQVIVAFIIFVVGIMDDHGDDDVHVCFRRPPLSGLEATRGGAARTLPADRS
jgi:hypothetical protein